jgi:FKBP-type peptidyl-prolyl cis-trans isomerase
MSPGDTAEFLIRADSFFVKEQHRPPGNLPPGISESTIFIFRIKLNSFATNKELMDDLVKRRAAMMEEIKARQKQEPADIKAYLKKNKYPEKPDADSIFYLKAFNYRGIGKQVKENDSVEIKYTGMFLDGSIFDQSDKGEPRMNFKILYSQNVPLIKGWISVIGKMHQGEKIRVLIPSSMAYGARGYSSIMPYTPLVFDIEIVSIKSNN